MGTDFHQPTDKSYKFMHKRLGIKFHRYFYKKGEKLRYIDTEIPDTGQRRDITCIVDEETIFDKEFQSTPIDDDKLHDMYDYRESLVCDKNYEGFDVRVGSVNTYNPKLGKRKIDIKYNITFEPDMFFTQERNGWEVLSTSIYKVHNRIELSDDEAIDLLILPDMDIDMSIRTLMKFICFLIVHANIPDENFKRDIVFCEMMVLKRFFNREEWMEMVKMLSYKSKDPKLDAIIAEYGMGFDLIYLDGKDAGFNEGELKAKMDMAQNLLAEGVDVGIISRCCGLSISQVEELKREL